ncbi:MAG: ABC transporter permease subunit [Ilumatobacteraceae bacterium]
MLSSFFISTKPCRSWRRSSRCDPPSWTCWNTCKVLVILYTGMNLPLAVWMLRSFFQEVPKELVEVAEIDGASSSVSSATGHLADRRTGHAATALLCLDLRGTNTSSAAQRRRRPDRPSGSLTNISTEAT